MTSRSTQLIQPIIIIRDVFERIMKVYSLLFMLPLNNLGGRMSFETFLKSSLLEPSPQGTRGDEAEFILVGITLRYRSHW